MIKMLHRTRRRRGPGRLVLVALLLGLGCGTEAVDLGPPEGWEGVQARWWRAGTDTSVAFRNLETLESMGIVEGDILALGARISQEQLVNQVKRSLLPFIRHQPEVVDSLFERYVTPKIEEAAVPDKLGDFIAQYKEDGYEILRRHFTAPAARTQLGMTVPDSLRRPDVGGTIEMQIYLNEEGSPTAVQLLQGVHPVLDSLALQATTQMQWQPAYVLVRRSWKPLPAWTRYNATIGNRTS